MKAVLKFSVLILALVSFSCSKVPITNRKQFNLIPEFQMIELGSQEYNKFISSHVVIHAPDSGAVLVSKVGKKVSDAIVNYLKTHNQSKRIKGYSWQFNLVQSNEVNAWCMPGGKVVVYSALLPVTKDENGLAVVLGHEIAHAIARHGNERMSQQLAIQLGGVALSVAMQSQAAQTANVFNQVYGASTTLGALAYSRKHETEADKLGLCFMAMAGYDPHTAVAFWERMAQQNPNQPLQILSTHPNDATRIAAIKAYIPTAMKYYKK